MSEYEFHENQIQTAEEIVGFIQTATIFCMLLLAQMQSGKTGTYLKVAFDCIKNQHMDQVIIICGSRDTSLRNQTQTDLENAIKRYSKIELSKKSREILAEKLKNRIKIYWSQDLKEKNGGPIKIENNTLIIHDESHAAQSKNNKPYLDFYEKHNIEKSLQGDNSQIEPRNIRILEVSATPFSSIIANEKIKNGMYSEEELQEIENENMILSKKKIVFANPGEKYKGINAMLSGNHIHFEAMPIKEDSHEHISRVLRDKYDKKYCIVRTKCAKKDEALMREIASNCDYDYISIFGTVKKNKSESEESEESDVFDFLKEEPSKRTIVHICGKARMGQQLDKTYIGMIYEQASNPNTDTILQGLLGRMCGYYGTRIPDIYISAKKKTEILEYADAWDSKNIEKIKSIKKALNLNGSNTHTKGCAVRDKSNNIWIKTIPVKFNIRDARGDGEQSWDSIGINDIVNMLEDKPELIANNPDKDEIIKLIQKCKFGRRDINADAYQSRGPGGIKQSLEKAVQDNKRETCGFSNCITEHITEDIKKPIQIIGSNINTEAFLIGFVKHNEAIHGKVDMDMPDIKSKCIHAISTTVEQEDSSVIEDFNGGQIITFPFEKTSDNIQEFEIELEKFILRTIPGKTSYVENCSRSISSMWCNNSKGYKGIYFKGKMPEIRDVAKKLSKKYREYRINVTIGNKMKTDIPGYTRIPSITW
jgi:hypothetical protein